MDSTNRSESHRFPTPRAELRRGLLAAGALLALLVLGTLLTTPRPAEGGLFRHHRHPAGFEDPQEVRDHAEFAVGWVLHRVDASDEQEARVNAVLGRLIEEVWPLAQQHRAKREAWRAELLQPVIDRDAIEQLRSAELALAEQASRSLALALAEIAEVLSPEQRMQLLEDLPRH